MEFVLKLKLEIQNTLIIRVDGVIGTFQAKRKLELDAPLSFDVAGRFKTPSQVKTPSKKKPRPSPKVTGPGK